MKLSPEELFKVVKTVFSWLFLLGNRAGWPVKVSELKIELPYSRYTLSGQLNPEKVWFQHFPTLQLLVLKVISEKFKPGFSSYASFLATTLTLLKESHKYFDAKFNGKLVSIKIPQMKNEKSRVPFLRIFSFISENLR